MTDELQPAIMIRQLDVLIVAEQKLGRAVTGAELQGIHRIVSLPELEACQRLFSSPATTPGEVLAELNNFASQHPYAPPSVQERKLARDVTQKRKGRYISRWLGRLLLYVSPVILLMPGESSWYRIAMFALYAGFGWYIIRSSKSQHILPWLSR